MTVPGQQPPPYRPAGTPPPGMAPPPYQGAPSHQGPPSYLGTPPSPPPPAYAAPPAPAGGYGYGPPADSRGGWNGPVKGKDLLRACWSLLKQDRSLLMLPVISAVAAFVALAIFFVPGAVVGFVAGADGSGRWAVYAGAIVGGFAASVVSIFFQAALVIGANERADGGNPTVGSAIAGAFARIGPILGWAVVTTVIGTLIRAVQRRAGVAGGLVGFLGGVAWAIATLLAVPVVVAEGVGPIEAVKRSSALIKSTWGLGLRSTLRFGLIQLLFFVPPVLLLVLGFVLLGQGSVGVGFGVALIAVALAALVVVGVVFGAIGQYARALLYRYATGRPVPGIDRAMLAGALAARR